MVEVVVPLLEGGDFKALMASSTRTLKKKKDAQLDALPSRFGVRPRYRDEIGFGPCRSFRRSETVVRPSGRAALLRWTGTRCISQVLLIQSRVCLRV